MSLCAAQKLQFSYTSYKRFFFQIFCPKDDTKHRALWRQLYTDSELQFLKRLIDKCRENNVTFVYGISPGLDISYSKAKEVGLLKAKLDQLKSAGCGGFCLLWDDIETTLPQVSKDVFRFSNVQLWASVSAL